MLFAGKYGKQIVVDKVAHEFKTCYRLQFLYLLLKYTCKMK